MGWRFRRTAQIVPGLRINLSRSGPSVSVVRVRTFPSASPGPAGACCKAASASRPCFKAVMPVAARSLRRLNRRFSRRAPLGPQGRLPPLFVAPGLLNLGFGF